MGTDIHVFIQIYNNGWKLIKIIIDDANPSHHRFYIMYNVNCCSFGIVDEKDFEMEDLLYDIDFDLSRDYESFAVLASVRGRGAVQKGWPEIDPLLYNIIEEFHSKTYFTEDEINAFGDLINMREMKILLKKVKEKYNYPVRFLIGFDS